MFTKKNSKKKLLIVTFISTLIFYLLAHSYRFFNPMFSGDSLLMIHQNDSAWQIALGRFVQPFLVLLRGGIVSPFLISALSILWVALSVYFLADFLEINQMISIIFIAAVMVCNNALLATNATFLHSMDFYTLSLFLSVLGAWLLKRGNLLYTILGSLSFCVSMGIYQAYICVAIGLVMIHFLFQMMNRPTFKDTCKNLLKYLSSFVAAAGIYYLVWKLFQKIFNIWTADSYNGLSSVGDYSDTSLWSIIGSTYEKVVNYFIHPETFTTMPFRGESLSIFWVYLLRFCNIATVLILFFALIRINFKVKTNLWHKIAQLFILAVFPLGINFVCILSKGMVHTLMIYAFCLVYVLAIKAAENALPDSLEHWVSVKPTKIHKSYIPWIAVLAFVLIVSWSNIVYSNQVYLKKDLQNEAIHSLMTRIVYEIESMEEYEAGVTPVAISGTFEKTPALSDMGAFKDILPYGMGNTSLTYMGTDYAYLNHILNVNMNLTRISNEHEIVKEMPSYPAEGSVAYVDGILVVKVSD